MAINLSGILLSLLLLNVFQINAQVIGKDASEQNWYKIYNQKISEDGNWSYYSKIYEDSKIEGILVNTKNKKTYTFSQPEKVFLSESSFIAKLKDDKMIVIQLKNGRQREIENVKSFYATNDQFTLIILNNSDWFVLDRSGFKHQQSSKILKVKSFENDQLVMLYTENTATLLDTNVMKPYFEMDLSASKVVAENHDVSAKTSRFLIKNNNIYTVKKYLWENKKILSYPVIIDYSFTHFSFGNSDVLIATKPTKHNEEIDNIEVLDDTERALKPYLEKNREIGYDAVILDYLNNKKFTSNYSEEITSRHLEFGDKYLLEVNNLANDTSTTEFIIPKIALRNLETDKEEFSVQATRFYSPVSEKKLLFYFNNRDWYFYDLITKQNINITENLGDLYFNFSRMNEKQTNPVADICFSKGYSCAYLTSRNNIWKFDLDTKEIKNITQNRDPNISYVILNKSSGVVEKIKGVNTRTIQENILLLGANTGDELSEALFAVINERVIEVEPFGNYHLDQFIIGRKYLSYTLENFNAPYQIVVNDYNGTKRSVRYNAAEKHLPKAEILKWKNENGHTEFLTVVLPPDYNPSIKYPAIVRVYENEAKAVKFFEYPTYYNQTGFNASLYALNGYIIIYPKVNYKVNEPGNSALVSVLSSIDHAAEKYSINKDRLGLIGHSFGGYETNYIITQTPIFRAAISGASISNILSSYFTMSKKYLRPNIWRYTDQSFRFSDGFFNLKEEYLRNNPIFFADRVKTPILLWTGKEDHHVEWEESLSFFIALQSIEKKCRLLLFKGESHTLSDPANQQKATEIFMNWFDYYLK